MDQDFAAFLIDDVNDPLLIECCSSPVRDAVRSSAQVLEFIQRALPIVACAPDRQWAQPKQANAPPRGTFVQAVNHALTVSGTTQTTGSISTTAHNTILFCAVYKAANAGTVTPSDSTGLTWTPVANSPYAGTASGLSLGVWVAANITGNAANTFTFASTGSDTPAIIICEFSSRARVSAVDITATASDSVSSSGAHTTGSITPNALNDDLLAFTVSSTVAQAFTAGGSWTIPTNGSVTGSLGYDCFVQYQNGVGAGAVSNAYSVTLSDKLDSFLVALQIDMQPYSDDSWMMDSDEGTFLLVDSYQQSDAAPAVGIPEDAWAHDDPDGDDWEWSAIDSAPVGPAQPARPVEDPQGYDNDDVGDDWEREAVQDSAPVGPSQPARPVEDPQGFDADDIGDDWDSWADYSKPVVANVALVPALVEDAWPHDDPEGDDWEWSAVDSAPVGPAQPARPVEDTQGADNDDIGDDYDAWATADSQPVGANAALVPGNPPEDAFDWTESDQSDEPPDDDGWSVRNANQSPLPVDDSWEHFPDDYEDELIILDDASFENFWADDPWEWTEDVGDYDLTDDAYNVNVGNIAPAVPATIEDAWGYEDDNTDDLVGEDSAPVGANQPAPPVQDAWLWDDEIPEELPDDDGSNVQYQNVTLLSALTPDDAWAHEDDHSDEWNADDSAPVGVNQPPLPVDDAWEWIDDEPPFLLIGSYQQSDNPNPVEDAWSWDDHEGDDWDVSDSAPIGANGLVVVPPGPDDAWNHEDDYTDEPFGDDSAPVGAAQPAPPVEDGWDWTPEDHDEWSADESAPVGPNFVAPAALCPDDAWDWIDDEPPYLLVGSYQQSDVPPPVEDAWDWGPEDYTDEPPDDDGSNVRNNNVIVIPPLCPEDSWQHEDDHTDEWDWSAADAAPVGPAQRPGPVEDIQGHDLDDAGDDWETWATSDSAPVGPNTVLKAGLGGEDAWTHEDDQTDEWDLPATDSAPVVPSVIPPAPPIPPQTIFSVGCCGVTYNLCIEQNATYTRIFTWLLQTASGQIPVSLVGCTALLQIKPFTLSTTVLYDASSDITLGGREGTITLSIPALVTAGFTWFDGVYELQLTDAHGNVVRLLKGTVSVCPGVTQLVEFILVPSGQAILLPSGQGILTP